MQNSTAEKFGEVLNKLFDVAREQGKIRQEKGQRFKEDYKIWRNQNAARYALLLYLQNTKGCEDLLEALGPEEPYGGHSEEKWMEV